MNALNPNFIHLQTFWEKISLFRNIYNKFKINIYKSVKKKIFFDIKDIAALTRSELELNCREMSQSVYLGDGRVLCRVLTKYMCYVAAKDLDITPHLCLNGYWESWVTQAMIRLLQPGFYCLDIGANCGYYSLIMADIVGESGRVVSIEPNPRLATLLNQSVNINGFGGHTTVLQKAVTEINGEKINLIIPGDGYLGRATIYQPTNKPEDELVEVETVTIDELTKDWLRVDLVKIDVEGAEEATWRGMQQTIQKNKNMIITMEFACDRGYDPKLFLEDIQAHGFSIRHIDYDSQVKNLSIDECLNKGNGEFWDLFLQREN